MLGGVVTGAVVVSGAMTGTVSSVRASEVTASGGGAACAPASSIMPIRASTPFSAELSDEDGTKRRFVSATGEPSCESLRFLMLPIL